MLTEPVTLATAHGRSLAITEVRGFEDGLELAIEEQSPDPEIAPAVLLEVTYPDGRIGRSSEGTGSASPEVVVSEFHRQGDVRTWFWISPVPNPRELLIDFTVPKWNVYHAHARLGMT